MQILTTWLTGMLRGSPGHLLGLQRRAEDTKAGTGLVIIMSHDITNHSSWSIFPKSIILSKYKRCGGKPTKPNYFKKKPFLSLRAAH